MIIALGVALNRKSSIVNRKSLLSRLLTRLADFARSRPLLHRSAHAAVRLIPDVRCTVRVADLGPLRIRLRRHRWFLWSSFAHSDAFTLGVFQRLIRPGDVVYDIGANIGLYTRILHSWFGAGQIIAFEPMRDNFQLLEENIALGNIRDRVKAYPIALSDTEGEEDLQIDDMTSGTAVLSSVSGGEASVGRREFGLPPLTEMVTIATLDRFINRERLPPPAVMKIDTEGAEVKVIAGAAETLRRHRPRLIIALHDRDKTIAVVERLDSLGYHCHGIVKSEGRTMYRQIHARDADSLANNNIAASVDPADVRDEIIPCIHPPKRSAAAAST